MTVAGVRRRISSNRHVILLAVGGIIGCATLARIGNRPPDRSPDWPVSELPTRMGRGFQPATPTVTVHFQFPLVPTDDPRVWRYHPGHPPKVVPPTYEVRFDSPPAFTGRLPVTVEGVPAFRPDALRRADGGLGVVVLTSARLPGAP